jgi:glycerol uptake facilitator-like aquaporin
MSPFVAELIGTMLMILLGDGVVANVVLKDTKGNNSGWMVITTAWGLAVFVGVVVAGPIFYCAMSVFDMQLIVSICFMQFQYP